MAINLKRKLNILSIDGDDDYSGRLQHHLEEDEGCLFNVRRVNALGQAVDYLARNETDLVLMDLSLPDCKGLDSFIRIQSAKPLTPVVILSDLDDDAVALESVRRGAQDYLIKNQTNQKYLPRILSYNIERSRLQMELRKLSLIDEVTGLYNRRGFWTITQQQMQLVERTHKGFIILAMDLDGMKGINDACGHGSGDQALKDAAQILLTSFRRSDIIARVGGDEFAVMAIESGPGSPKLLVERIQENVRQHNQNLRRDFILSLSIGAIYYDPSDPQTLDVLLKRADEAMYQNKKKLV
jgi:diguanylate cyclase (GGDEF)-like protein